ncbi:MAG: VOC family protein [Legionellales bacterium]|nr:VOC family protein [Legionellales bacterium]
MTISINASLQLIYVSDIEKSCAFYKKIFNSEPVFSSPRYIAFDADGNQKALFAIWSGGTIPEPDIPRFSEVGIILPSNEDVDNLFNQWKAHLDIEFIQEPTTEIFGRTFLIKDPDGHIIRVSPLDK